MFYYWEILETDWFFTVVYSQIEHGRVRIALERENNS